jgi:hypothetical protein
VEAAQRREDEQEEVVEENWRLRGRRLVGSLAIVLSPCACLFFFFGALVGVIVIGDGLGLP